MNNRNKVLIILGMAILVISAMLFFIGAMLEGWDFVAFIKSPIFIWDMVILGLFCFGLVFILISDRINKL